MVMKVLITGAGGQLGLHLTSALQKIVWIDLLCVERQALDITDDQQVEFYFEKNRPNIVINAAAFTAVDDAEVRVFDANQVNHIGAGNLAKAAAKVNAVIIQVSTDYVFSGEASAAYVECDVTKPINVYGQTKLAGENVVAQFNSKHIILRTSWLFGESGKNFYLTLVHLLNTKSRINLVNDQIGAPTYVPDFVGLIIKIIRKLNEQSFLSWGVYHYSGYPFVSWFEFAQQIQRSLYPDGSRCNLVGVSSEFYNSAAKRPLSSRLDSSKACDYFELSASDWRGALHRLATNVKE